MHIHADPNTNHNNQFYNTGKSLSVNKDVVVHRKQYNNKLD